MSLQDKLDQAYNDISRLALENIALRDELHRPRIVKFYPLDDWQEERVIRIPCQGLESANQVLRRLGFECIGYREDDGWYRYDKDGRHFRFLAWDSMPKHHPWAGLYIQEIKGE